VGRGGKENIIIYLLPCFWGLAISRLHVLCATKTSAPIFSSSEAWHEGCLPCLIVEYRIPLARNLKSGTYFLRIVKATTLRLFVRLLKPMQCAAAALTLHPALPPIQKSPALVLQSRHVRVLSLAPGSLSIFQPYVCGATCTTPPPLVTQARYREMLTGNTPGRPRMYSRHSSITEHCP